MATLAVLVALLSVDQGARRNFLMASHNQWESWQEIAGLRQLVGRQVRGLLFPGREVCRGAWCQSGKACRGCCRVGEDVRGLTAAQAWQRGLPGAGEQSGFGQRSLRAPRRNCHWPFRLGRHSPVQNGGGAAHLARVEPDSAPPHPDPKSGPQKSLPWVGRGRTGIRRLLMASVEQVNAEDCQVLRNLQRRGHMAQFLPGILYFLVHLLQILNQLIAKILWAGCNKSY